LPDDIKITKNKNAFGNIPDLLVVAVILLVAIIAYLLFFERQIPASPTTHGQTDSRPGMNSSLLSQLPQDFGSLVSLGHSFMDSANYPMAAEVYARALAIDSSSLDLRTDYATCLNGMGLPDRAIDEFRRVLVINPSHMVAHFNLGIVFQAKNAMDSARAHWQEYLNLDPNGPAAQSVRNLLQETKP